jgi:hypothetical protein
MPTLLASNKIDRAALADVKTPAATDTWCPIPHEEFFAAVERALRSVDVPILRATHALDHGTDRYFGLLELEPLDNEVALAVGLRNSHDQSFPLGIASGMHVFVCSNLSFSGEAVTVGRKHTARIREDLDDLIAAAVAGLLEHRGHAKNRIDRYRDTELSDNTVHDLLIRSLDAGVIPASKIPAVREHWAGRRWTEPEETAFDGRTAWRLFNAYTSVLKESDMFKLPKRTQALHRLLDRIA